MSAKLVSDGQPVPVNTALGTKFLDAAMKDDVSSVRDLLAKGAYLNHITPVCAAHIYSTYCLSVAPLPCLPFKTSPPSPSTASNRLEAQLYIVL